MGLVSSLVANGPMSYFAETILRNKRYVHEKGSGRYETWPEATKRVSYSVVDPYLPKLTTRINDLMEARKFIPGGRYLYSSGRKFPQVNNCFSGETRIITKDGSKPLAELVGQEIEVVNKFGEWEKASVRSFGEQRLFRILFTRNSGIWPIYVTLDHLWWMRDGTRISTGELASVSRGTIPFTGRPDDVKVHAVEDAGITEDVFCCVVPGSESFTLANGLLTSNCFLYIAEDSREGVGGWADIMSSATHALMTGGGIGVVYSKLRAEGEPIQGLGGQSTGPLALMQMVNECGRYIIQGGSRRSAIWAGLHWNHPDICKFIQMKNVSSAVRRCKEEDFNFPVPMDGTNISVILDDAFFKAYYNPHDRDCSLAQSAYWTSIRQMLETGEPGFSIDIGENSGENARNACTEITSRDNGDLCNLSSLNMARFANIEEFRDAVELVTAFLLCGTLYSKLPVQSMYKVREKNRRIGLGLMGVHEWLIRRGKKYGRDKELARWLEVYAMSGAYANYYADRLSISRPVATRSIAPTGTISIIGETTSGIEPIFSVAYKRRYLDGKSWKAQYVVDAAARRLVDSGVDPDSIEDAYSLAEDIDRRLDMQAFMQEYVDHGISSTINLPRWGSSLNNENTVTGFGKKLLDYLPRLRGITAYPDGARGGQPLNRVNYHEAIGREGTAFLENEESCKGGVCSG